MPDENWEIEKSRNWAISEQKRLEIVKTNGRKIEKLSLQCGPKIMEPNLEKLWVNFWPIYAKNGHFWGKKRGGQFGKHLGQVVANLCRKMAIFKAKKTWRPIWKNFESIFGQFMQTMAIFEAKNVEANLDNIWANFEQFLANLCKKWPFFRQKWTQIKNFILVKEMNMSFIC